MSESLLFPEDQQRIEQACLQHPFGSQQAAEVIEMFAYLSGLGYDWKFVITDFAAHQPIWKKDILEMVLEIGGNKYVVGDYVWSVHDLEGIRAETLGLVLATGDTGHFVQFAGGMGLMCQDEDLRRATATKYEVVNTPNPAESYLRPTEFE